MPSPAESTPGATTAAQLEAARCPELPTNLFIGGVWREASDRRNAGSDRGRSGDRARARRPWPTATVVPTQRSTGSRRRRRCTVCGVGVSVRRANRRRDPCARTLPGHAIGQKLERIARLITLENVQGSARYSRAEAAYAPPSSSAGMPRKRCAASARLSRAPSSGRAHPRPAQARRRRRARDAVEFPAAMGTRKIALRARGRLHR